jgi:hypothetical protein
MSYTMLLLLIHIIDRVEYLAEFATLHEPDCADQWGAITGSIDSEYAFAT